ncbi:hypothetical protein [Arthrobacter sp. AFG20]|uniref:hypothetical protein n=1 Tax=Arthrobacter sp. AFG20 TaxID=1688671 RepID=UPI0015E1290D|nr:hypothetical protein [Arthrobacter sp. AFG20]
MLGVVHACRSAVVRFPGTGTGPRPNPDGNRLCPRAAADPESARTFAGAGARTAGSRARTAGATGGPCGAGAAHGARDSHGSCAGHTGRRSRRRPGSE